MEQKNFLEKFWYIFIIIALILIAMVGILWFNNQKSLKTAQQNQSAREIIIQPTPTILIDTETANLETQGNSDEIVAIENDIKATDFTNLDKEMATIETELAKPE